MISTRDSHGGNHGDSGRFPAQIVASLLLYRLQKELAEAKPDALLLVTLNRRFHQAIYEAAHNQYLLQTLNMLHDSLALLHNATFRVPSRRSDSDEEHHRIVVAIEKHDPGAAEEAAREHIRQAQRTRFEGGA